MSVLVLFGAPFLVGLVLGGLFARGPRHVLGLVLLGIVLGFGLLVWAYLVAPPSYSQSNGCSDCEEFLGRWWEPVFVGYLAVFANVGYLAGVGLGALARVLMKTLRPTS